MFKFEVTLEAYNEESSRKVIVNCASRQEAMAIAEMRKPGWTAVGVVPV